jgi:hypothetical protein
MSGTDVTTMSPRDAVDRLLKPIQQFTRGWMTTTATGRRAVDLGFPSGYEFWVVGRAGVLGTSEPQIAAAGLAFVAPSAVEAAFAARPSGMSAGDVAGEFSARCTAWGAEALASFDRARMAQLDELGRRVIDAAPAALGAVFAGWRAMPPPADLGGRVALTTHVLREMRGAAHIAAVIGAGITPLDAILASPAAPPRSGPEWAAHMGWPPPYRDASEVKAARAEAEDRTGEIMAAYLSVLDSGERSALVELVTTTRESIEM